MRYYFPTNLTILEQKVIKINTEKSSQIFFAEAFKKLRTIFKATSL